MWHEHTVPALLSAGEANLPALAGDGIAVDSASLLRACSGIAAALEGVSVSRRDRVAIVTRNGPLAAVGFLGASLAAVAAPLNPAYRRSELEFAFDDLPAAALLTDGSNADALAIAEERGIPVVLLDERTWNSRHEYGGSEPRPGDVALVLHTSGTTGTPKRVPLTHANLVHSARNIAASLELTPADRCLNVMPLFHIHGLVGAVLASLSAGASVVCTPGFDAFRFAGWLESWRPTWYTAVPSMHQAILARVKQAPDHRLRFARSASSALPGVVHEGVESLFGAPLLEAYGMTEASHQVAVNPLPPAERRPGSVGKPAGVEVAVFDASGAPVQAGCEGEVGIRGPSVTAGYEGVDPASFTYPGGWLRTGDQGRLDADGYLWLTGRLKELINRGGEKVSPREVEDVLLGYPGVAQAVVFAIPDRLLGEDVGAAVVAAAGAPVDAAAIRSYAGERLAPFKVPRKLVVVDEIPLGPTGKPQRVGMAARLGLR